MSRLGKVGHVPRKVRRDLSDFSVDIPVGKFDELRKAGVVRKVDGVLDVWYVPEEFAECYDCDLGLHSDVLDALGSA